jgi:hypothetical protein
MIMRSLLGELDFLSVGVLTAATVERHSSCLIRTTEVSGTPSFDQSRCKQHWYFTADHLVAHSSLVNIYSRQNCVRFLIHVRNVFVQKCEPLGKERRPKREYLLIAVRQIYFSENHMSPRFLRVDSLILPGRSHSHAWVCLAGCEILELRRVSRLFPHFLFCSFESACFLTISHSAFYIPKMF